MKRSLPALLVLLMLLALPFAMRPRQSAIAGQGESLVILSPHNGAIRYELTRAFVAHMARQGRKVELDWRSPGGTTEITRYLVGEYASAFERYWTGTLHRAWSPTVAASFSSSADGPRTTTASAEALAARRAFLDSNVGCGIDLLFGGGSTEAGLHASAGRLVDAGIVSRHPEMFGEAAIPEMLGGEPFWDREGRWLGTCLSGFGICFNRDALKRLGVARPPASWSDLTAPVYLGQLGLADPGKSGSMAKAFEMIIQEQMQEQLQEQLREQMKKQTQLRQAGRPAAPAGATDRAIAEGLATHAGWQAAMRLIRRVAANSRYFSDAASRIPIDVATGDAAAGMCIDFYGRFQSELTNAAAGRARMGFTMPKTGSSLGADAIGLLRGAPHRALAVEFMEFVLSEEGQKVWTFRVGSPGGPARYSLQRLPVLPALYAAKYDAYRADPATQPYGHAPDFVYRPEWTAPLFRAISFVVRVMCVEPAAELEEAYRALSAAHFPPRATALFDDVSAVDYDTVRGPLRAALRAPSAVDEVAWANRLVRQFREQYRQVAVLARRSRTANEAGRGDGSAE